jgi:hypothetical protein
MTSFRDRVKKSRENARKVADEQTDKDLKVILENVDDLEGIFNGLKLNDQAAYDQLIAVVEKATERNESIATVVDRLKALGEAGMKLAATAGNVTGPGALKAVLEALKES